MVRNGVMQGDYSGRRLESLESKAVRQFFKQHVHGPELLAPLVVEEKTRERKTEKRRPQPRLLGGEAGNQNPAQDTGQKNASRTGNDQPAFTRQKKKRPCDHHVILQRRAEHERKRGSGV